MMLIVSLMSHRGVGVWSALRFRLPVSFVRAGARKRQDRLATGMTNRPSLARRRTGCPPVGTWDAGSSRDCGGRTGTRATGRTRARGRAGDPGTPVRCRAAEPLVRLSIPGSAPARAARCSGGHARRLTPSTPIDSASVGSSTILGMRGAPLRSTLPTRTRRLPGGVLAAYVGDRKGPTRKVI